MSTRCRSSSLLLFLLVCVALKHRSLGETIFIDSNITSVSENETLYHYLCEATERLSSDTTIELSVGTHYIELGPPCVIKGLDNFTIRGTSDSEVTTIFCRNDIVGGGFVFINMTNMLLENIEIINCGITLPDEVPTTIGDIAFFGPRQKIVLFFSHCTDLRLTNVAVNHCYGFGIVSINLMGSTALNRVTIANTHNDKHFLCVSSSIGASEDFSCSGSGAVLMHTDDSITRELGNENATLIIADSSFENNTNIQPFSFFLPLFLNVRTAATTEPIVVSGASGLAVQVGQLEYFVDVLITNTTIQGNEGDIGGMMLLFYNSIRNSRMRMNNCTIRNNIARLITRGGGLIILPVLYLDRLSSFPSYPNDVYELLSITDSTFYGNCAAKGGAVFIHLPPQNVTAYRITVERTKFIKNQGSGPAIEAGSLFSSLVRQAIHLLFIDIEAHDNVFSGAFFTGSSLESAAVFNFLTIHNVTIVGTVEGGGSQFYNNSLGVILASGGNVFLSGHIKFENNFAFNGGAVSLYDNALLYIHEGSKLEFINNQALRFGGAIYSASLGSNLQFACAIQIVGPSTVIETSEVNTLNISVSFTNNSAGEAGNSIYANPIYECGYLPESSLQHTSIIGEERALYEALFNFPSTTDNGIKEISSVPNRICICNQTEFIQELCDGIFQSVFITTSPGQAFTVYLVAVDIVVNQVSSLVYAQIKDSSDAAQLQLGPDEDIRQLSGTGCNAVDYSLYGKENTFAIIDLFAVPGGIPVTLEVTVGACPLGFEIARVDGLQQCSCSNFITSTVRTTCNLTSFSIKRPGNSWIGVRYQGNESQVAYVSTCPIEYCNEFITEVTLSISDQICENNRTGILCGQCSDGFSVIFGSAQCSRCTHFWLFSIPFFALVGVALVLVLFLAKLTVTQGTIHGVIFYVNIVSVNANIFFRSTNRNFLFNFISLLNLELGFPLCFFNRMDEIAKVGLQFVFPTYLLLLCGGIILLSRHSSRIQKLTSCSAIPVLATLFYLSYSKILRTVIDILSFATLKKDSNLEDLVWLFDGNVIFCTGVHLLLFILALLTIFLFILPYTLSLALVFLLQRFTGMVRTKALVDAYLAPYKDKYRFWFGLRLLVLLVMCVTYAVTGTDNPSLALFLQLLVVTAFSIAQAYVQPFKSFAIGLLDMYFILNFIILSLSTSYILGLGTRDRSGQKTVVGVMIGLAFAVFIGIIVCHVITALRTIPRIRKATDRLCSKIKRKFVAKVRKNSQESDEGTYEPDAPSNDMELSMKDSGRQQDTKKVELTKYSPRTTEVSIAGLTSDSDDLNTEFRPPVLTFSQLREPVLDYM